MSQDTQAIERYRVYTRDEAALLMRMSPDDMDTLLETMRLAAVSIGRRKTYLGEILLRAQGADLIEVPIIQYHPCEIYPNAVYSAEQAAQLLHVPLRTLQHLSSTGQLRKAQLGKHPVYLGQELLRFLQDSIREGTTRKEGQPTRVT
jgi:hypothetical protein